jgi:hypothetical protein
VNTTKGIRMFALVVVALACALTARAQKSPIMPSGRSIPVRSFNGSRGGGGILPMTIQPSVTAPTPPPVNHTIPPPRPPLTPTPPPVNHTPQAQQSPLVTPPGSVNHTIPPPQPPLTPKPPVNHTPQTQQSPSVTLPGSVNHTIPPPQPPLTPKPPPVNHTLASAY